MRTVPADLMARSQARLAQVAEWDEPYPGGVCDAQERPRILPDGSGYIPVHYRALMAKVARETARGVVPDLTDAEVAMIYELHEVAEEGARRYKAAQPDQQDLET